MPTKEAKDAHSLSSLSPQKRSKMLTKEAQIVKKKKAQDHTFSLPLAQVGFPFLF
jgi:hypothetical protein